VKSKDHIKKKIYVLELKYQIHLEECSNPFIIMQIGIILNVLEWSSNKSQNEILNKLNHVKQDSNQYAKYIGFAEGITITTLEWILK